MKHICPMTKAQPSSADAVQEVICAVNQVFADLLRAMGGSSPLLSYIEDKCDLPGRNGESES